MNQEPKFCVKCKHVRCMKEYTCICCHPCCLDVVTERPRDCREVRQDTCLEQAIYYKEK